MRYFLHLNFCPSMPLCLSSSKFVSVQLHFIISLHIFNEERIKEANIITKLLLNSRMLMLQWNDTSSLNNGVGVPILWPAGRIIQGELAISTSFFSSESENCVSSGKLSCLSTYMSQNLVQRHLDYLYAQKLQFMLVSKSPRGRKKAWKVPRGMQEDTLIQEKFSWPRNKKVDPPCKASRTGFPTW